MMAKKIRKRHHIDMDAMKTICTRLKFHPDVIQVIKR